MTVRNSELRYGAVAMTFHWIIAALVLVNIGLGFWFGEFMTRQDPNLFATVQMHKSIGLTVLVLSLLRLGWRLINPVPPLPPDMHPSVRLFAQATHYFFYFLIIAIPLSGWLMVSASSLGNGTLFFGLFDWPNVPVIANLPRADKHPVHEMFETVHVILAWGAVVLIPIHVAAALYHQFLRRDDVLRRMLPGTRAGATP